MTELVDKLLRGLHLFAIEELGRVAMTAVILLALPMVLKLTKRILASKDASSMTERRGRLSIWRNAIFITSAACILAIWGSKIAGFALSLAAVAGAILIVSKEALLNLIGFATLTISKPFSFGDYIEMGGTTGRVVDINAMSTTVMETVHGNQVTGATATIPNSFLLTQTIRNITITGEYVVYMLPVQISKHEDILAHENALVQAANEVCGPWHEQASAYLEKLEQAKNMDLPSADIRVIVSLDDPKTNELTLRFTCMPNDRVKVEQRIIRHYIQGVSHLEKRKNSTAGEF